MWDRCLLLAGVAAQVFCCAAPASGSGTGVFPRNVILIVSDALRPDVLGAYGGEASTPYIDSLAEGGVTFLNAFSTSSWTGPSSVSMLTANYPTSYPSLRIVKGDRMVWASMVPDEEVLPAEVLLSAGFTTASYVENRLVTRNNVLQGFSTFLESADLEPLTRELMAESPVPIPLAGKKTPYPVSDYLIHLGEQERLFMLIWFLDPHSPYKPHSEYMEDLDFDSTLLPRPPQFYTRVSGIDLKALADSLSRIETDYLKTLYLGEVESVDRRIGFILSILEARGLRKDTLIILTSDHGEAFGEHGMFSHGHGGFPNTLCHVPLIIAGPGIPGGKTVTCPVSHRGLAPTILDFLGIEAADTPAGKSFKDLMYEDGIDYGPVYLVDVTDNSFAILDSNYKLVVSRGDTALYSMRTDRDEANSVASVHPHIVKELITAAETIRESNFRRRVELETRQPIASESDSRKAGIIDAMRSLGYIH